MRIERDKMKRSTFLRVVLSLTIGGVVFLFMLLVFPLIFWVNPFIGVSIAATITGIVVSMTYSNNLVECAIIGLAAPYFGQSLFSTLFFSTPLGFSYFLPTHYLVYVPTLSMFSALFSRKEFRDKIRGR